MNNLDDKTAKAFASSWNNLPEGSVYTKSQFEDWMSPITRSDVKNKRVLELGCGNASLMVHMASWSPSFLEGIDLGDSVMSAKKNMNSVEHIEWKVTKGDLVKWDSEGFDLVYCIGVIHHLKDPKAGFEAVIRNTKRGGKFHVWVYAREGNALVRYIVDPIRKIASRLPWMITKYLLATPLAVPFFIYAKIVKILPAHGIYTKVPMHDYMIWIANREFAFFRHVAFDQLVTPQTAYISLETIKKWLESSSEIDHKSIYVVMRNGNSWKFGGKKLQ